MTEIKEFELTEEHLKLLKELEVDWNYAEFGAPTIDLKRPYGNSDVYKDMFKILGWKLTISINDGPDEVFDIDNEKLPNSLIKILEKLHRELETALQICLSTQSFVPGNYELNEDDNWRKVYGDT